MSFRFTAFFRANSGYGWTETYYSTVQSSALTNFFQTFITKRTAILGSDVFLTRIRTNTQVKRVVLIQGAGGGTGAQGQQPPPTCAEEVALDIQLLATPAGGGRKFIRGIPEAVVSENTYIPISTFDPQLKQFENLLQSGQFNMQGRLNLTPNYYPISSLTPTPPRGINLTSAQLPAQTVGSVLRIKQVNIPGYNGLKVVQTVTPGVGGLPTLYGLGGSAPSATPPLSMGMVGPSGLYDNPIYQASVVAVTRRAAGRPFGQSRGRRQTTYSLRR